MTFADSDARKLEQSVAKSDQERGRVVAGNWLDPKFRVDGPYPTVVADYLLGSLDAYSPYRQRDLLVRLLEEVEERLYFVGKEPLPRALATAQGGEGADWELVLGIENLRDACILHAGHRPHREYPLDWVERTLREVGFSVEKRWTLGILYGESDLKTQLEVCRRKLPFINDSSLVRALSKQISRFERQIGRAALPVALGFDYVICARPTPAS